MADPVSNDEKPDTMLVFSSIDDDPQRFGLSLADICNGIACVSGQHFSDSEVILMAAHIITSHGTSKDDPVATLTGVRVQRVEVDDDDAPKHDPDTGSGIVPDVIH